MLNEYSPRWARKHRSEFDFTYGDEDDMLLVWWSALRVAVLNWRTPDGARWDDYGPALRAYRAWRLELGQDGLTEAWKAARAGHELLWPLLAFNRAGNVRYRGSKSQKLAQAKYRRKDEVRERRAELAKVHGPRYQSKPEVKARRAELARARRAARKEAAC